jgi:hypothetical protein
VLMLQEIIRRHIEPKVFTVDFHPVSITGGWALVIRIRKTWAGVHMVTYNDDFRFYTRHQGGRRLMDVPEIRSGFAGGESAAQKLSAFRSERLARLASGERLIPTHSQPLLVVHFFALESFSPGYHCNLRALTGQREDWMRLAPKHQEHGWRLRFSLDGPMAYITTGTAPDLALLYTQVFRNGAIEFVDSDIIDSNSERVVSGVAVEMEVFLATTKFLEAARRLELNPPYYILPALLGVDGWKLQYFVNPHERDSRALQSENIVLPETTLENATVDLERAFRPAFDVMFNSCGLRESPHYDADGKYVPDWRKYFGLQKNP